MFFADICRRERCPVSFVGEVTGDGYMSLVEDSYTDKYLNRTERLKPETKPKLPFDLHLEAVLGMYTILESINQSSLLIPKPVY